MAWSFADSFDLYAAAADTINGYWDSGTLTGIGFVAGRFSGQAINMNNNASFIVKSSGVNDAVHHIVVSVRQTSTLTGSTNGCYLQLLDGATGQCAIVFRSDGAILLNSGTTAGTTLATYTGALTASNTWYAFEFEVVIHPSAGTFKVRKNGNTTEDFTATALNTRPGTNSYANKLTLGQVNSAVVHHIDDLFWQSSAAAGTWLGDIRCYTRMPASDASVVFSRSPATYSQTNNNGGMAAGSSNITANQINYSPFTPSVTGSVGALVYTVSTTSTANFKCSIYASNGSGGSPGTVLGSATGLSAPGVGSATFTFSTPVPVVAGTAYWVGFGGDAASGQIRSSVSSVSYYFTSSGYAAFPVNNPAVTASTATQFYFSVSYTPSANFMSVSEAQQDAATTYVYSSNPGDADFYGIGAISATPASVLMVTTRAYAQKSDAGTRTLAAQLKSGATTVASPTLTLTTSGWQWAWRSDLTDPNTGAAWSVAGVNNATIGPKVIA